MKDIKDRAREYLIKHSEYSEVFDQTFVAVDTLTAMVDFAEQENAELKKELEQERKINEEIKVRFVQCSSCTEEMKDKCLMFSENLCEGERCEELVDLVALVNQSELQNKCSDLEKENAELQVQIKKLKAYNEKLLDGDIEKHNKIVELQNRNGELAGQKASLGRWLGEAKEIIKEFVRVEYADFTNGDYSNELSKVLERAEDFLKE